MTSLSAVNEAMEQQLTEHQIQQGFASSLGESLSVVAQQPIPVQSSSSSSSSGGSSVQSWLSQGILWFNQ
jgi:hypothetical protein